MGGSSPMYVGSKGGVVFCINRDVDSIRIKM